MSEFTEVTQQGCMGRLMSSIKGIAIGFILLVAAVIALFWNETNFVKTRAAYLQMEGEVGSGGLTADKIHTDMEGKAIHMTGTAKTDEVLKDPVFEVEMTGFRLSRKVEMYQWEEIKETKKKKKLGGGEERVTTYRYEKKWSDNVERIQHSEGAKKYKNPSFPFKSWSKQANDVLFGAYKLPTPLISKVRASQGIPVTQEMLEKLNQDETYLIHENGFYKGNDPSDPQIGDLKIHFSYTKSPQDISILAKQVNDSFTKWTAKNGYTVLALDMGKKDASSMFAGLHSSNKTQLWVIRIVGLLFIFFGFKLILGPFVVLADVVPFIGNLMEGGTTLISLGLTLLFGGITIAIAWLAARPIIGITVIVVAVAAVIGLFVLFKKKRDPDLPPPRPA